MGNKIRIIGKNSPLSRGILVGNKGGPKLDLGWAPFVICGVPLLRLPFVASVATCCFHGHPLLLKPAVVCGTDV